MLWWCFHFIWIFDLKLKKNTQNDFIVAFALCYLWMVSEKLRNLKVFRQFQFKRNGNCYLIENNGKWYTLETPFYPSTHIHRKHAFRRTRDDGKFCVVFISFYAIAPFVLMLVYHLSFHLHWSNGFFCLCLNMMMMNRAKKKKIHLQNVAIVSEMSWWIQTSWYPFETVIIIFVSMTFVLFWYARYSTTMAKRKHPTPSFSQEQ